MNRRKFLEAAAAACIIETRLAGQTESAGSKIGRFVANFRYDALTPKALEWAKTAILDCLGVAVAGSREESSRITAALARQEKAAEEATLYGHGFKSSVAQAAFTNGISAHATDFDHSFVVGGQPSAPIIPAIFALGESIGASGKQILEAYGAGFEVMAKLIFAEQSGRPVGVPVSVFGATAACSRLLGLSEAQIEMALGIAAAMVSGVGIDQGTMGKPLGVGAAARSGTLAARMAKAGYTAGKPAFPPFEELGREPALEKYGVRLKAYPCGGLTHAAIYSTIQLRNEHSITAEMVDRISVDVPQNTANTILYRVPKSGLQGKFSMGYLVSRALVDGNLTLETFTDDAVRDPRVLGLVEKVEMKVDPALPPSTSADGSRPATVTIHLKDGKTYTHTERYPKGSPQVPMTAEELKTKVRACVRGAIGDRIITYISSLETMPDIRPLTNAIR